MKKPMSLKEIGVHAAHCCPRHGCKYGDENCPVVKGVVEGRICEDCLEDEEMEYVVIRGIYEDVFKDLDARERRIINLRFGFNKTGEEVSKEIVSAMTNTPVEQITALEHSVIQTLRTRLRKAWADNSAGRVLD